MMKIKKLLSIAMLILFAMCGQLIADTIVIDVDVDQCEISVTVPVDNGCDENECTGDDTCVCAGMDDQIEWSLPPASNKEFKLKFRGASPLKKCGDKFTKQKKKCGLKSSLRKGESFNYEIELKHCDQPLDPRIVIK